MTTDRRSKIVVLVFTSLMATILGVDIFELTVEVPSSAPDNLFIRLSDDHRLGPRDFINLRKLHKLGMKSKRNCLLL